MLSDLNTGIQNFISSISSSSSDCDPSIEAREEESTGSDYSRHFHSSVETIQVNNQQLGDKSRKLDQALSIAQSRVNCHLTGIERFDELLLQLPQLRTKLAGLKVQVEATVSAISEAQSNLVYAEEDQLLRQQDEWAQAQYAALYEHRCEQEQQSELLRAELSQQKSAALEIAFSDDMQRYKAAMGTSSAPAIQSVCAAQELHSDESLNEITLNTTDTSALDQFYQMDDGGSDPE